MLSSFFAELQIFWQALLRSILQSLVMIMAFYLTWLRLVGRA